MISLYVEPDCVILGFCGYGQLKPKGKKRIFHLQLGLLRGFSPYNISRSIDDLTIIICASKIEFS